MNRVSIDEATLRSLVAEQPFYAIAKRYGCSTRAISLLARAHGLSSAFVSRGPTAAEDGEIADLLASGQSIQGIAREIGRSHDFVARRIRRLHGPEERRSRGLPGRPGSCGWPVPDTSAEAMLQGRRFEDIAEEILDRECPPGRLPINGAALATAGRVRNLSFTRSAADVCRDEYGAT